MQETSSRADGLTQQNGIMFDDSEREWVREFHG
jgi:hypothetical protein